MKKRSLLTAILGGVLFLLSLSSCYNRVVPLPPWIFDSPDKEEPLTEEESLKGQWAVMEEEGVETPEPYIIDIQHTLPDYWIVVNTSEEPVIGIPFKSDRTETEDGVFVISLDDYLGEGFEMSYSFVDNERNTLKAEAKDGDMTVMTFILERIPSEEEIKMHIVSFKLDDSFASADYVLTSAYISDSFESLAIEAGKAFGEKGFPTLKQKDTEVPALFKLADGNAFTADTLVTDDITVIVAPM